MIFIWGTKRYSEDLGESGEHCICSNCNNRVNLRILNAYTKFTFFFIPLFRTGSNYRLACPICSHGRPLKPKEAKQLLQAH